MTTISNTTEFALAKLQEMLNQGHWPAGELLPSERRIAADLNVSRTPLRAALIELTRRGQLKRNEPRGYLVVGDESQTLTPMAQTIGILTYKDAANWEPNASADRIEYSVRKQVVDRGSHLIQFNPDNVDEATIQWIKQQRLSGIIATHELAQSDAGKAILNQLKQRNVPVVVHGNSPCLASFDRVFVDQQQGMYAMTHWLLEQGCQNILRLWGNMAPDVYWLQMRNAGFEQACMGHNVEPTPVLHWPKQPVMDEQHAATLREMLGRWIASYLAERLKNGETFDAIVCISDAILQATARACEILGIDPNRDLKICGFDNVWHRRWPTDGPLKHPIADVDTQPDATGRAMVELLEERISGALPAEPQLVMVQPKLVITGQ
ncbi:MAG: hypothetical protein CMJ19_13675 [Phycisphaeraceae bacterium]|nr:hypothetical protein [Phycisphaeraceae bacterium]